MGNAGLAGAVHKGHRAAGEADAHIWVNHRDCGRTSRGRGHGHAGAVSARGWQRDGALVSPSATCPFARALNDSKSRLHGPKVVLLSVPLPKYEVQGPLAFRMERSNFCAPTARRAAHTSSSWAQAERRAVICSWQGQRGDDAVAGSQGRALAIATRCAELSVSDSVQTPSRL